MSEKPNKPFVWKSNTRVSRIHRLKADEGGMSQHYAAQRLFEAGIPYRRAESSLVGHWAIDVPEKFRLRAERVL